MTCDPITTGLPTLDAALGGGLRPGTLTLVAGPSQSGTTTTLDTIACAAAFRDRVPTVLADLETTTHQRVLRLTAALSGVDLIALQRGALSPDDMTRARQADRRAAGAPFWFADTATTVRDLTRALRHPDGTQARLLLVDGARFLSEGTPEQIVWRLCTLADALGIAVVATQPTAIPPARHTHPMEAVSWGMACAADNVIVLHRPDLDGNTDRAGELDVQVAFTRRGTPDTITVAADYPRARLCELLPDPVAAS